MSEANISRISLAPIRGRLERESRVSRSTERVYVRSLHSLSPFLIQHLITRSFGCITLSIDFLRVCFVQLCLSPPASCPPQHSRSCHWPLCLCRFRSEHFDQRHSWRLQSGPSRKLPNFLFRYKLDSCSVYQGHTLDRRHARNH